MRHARSDLTSWYLRARCTPDGLLQIKRTRYSAAAVAAAPAATQMCLRLSFIASIRGENREWPPSG
jgi:hypothetical protein